MADRGDAAHRLDHAAARHLAASYAVSRSELQRLIIGGRVLVNGVPATRPAQRVLTGDVVQVDVARPPARQSPAAEALPLSIIYEDAQLLVVVKPSGMVAHPSHKHRSGTLLNALLWHATEVRGDDWQPRLVQRLDKDTSGLLLVAKSGAVQTALQGDRVRLVKEYLAVVWGRPAPAYGVITHRLGRDALDRRRVVAVDSGAAAETRYRVLDRSRGAARGLSLVSCELVTGRTHQLRVHLAAQGWPIVGDPIYGHPPRRRLLAVAVDRAARAFPRQALHAWRLAFTHPDTGRRLRFEAPVPPDMAAVMVVAELGRGLPASPTPHV